MRIVGALLKQFGPTSGSPPPAAPTLAVTDNADGTGGVATISGAGADTITVYSQAVNGELGTNTWTARGNRVGNGAITLSPAPAVGYYWWKAVASSAGGEAVSNLVYQPITNGTQAVWYRCLTAIQSRLQGLSLSGIASGNIKIRKLPWLRDVAAPAIVISPVPETMNPSAGTVGRDDVEYRVQITVFRASNQDLITNVDLLLKWREKIARAFRNQRLPGVDEIYVCYIDPGPLVPHEAFAANVDAQALTIRCISREVRGI